MKSRSRSVLAPTAFAFWIAARPEREIGGGRRVMRIVEQAQRDAPIRDPAFGIGLERLLEYLFGFPVPERMLVAHAAVEPPLRRLVARGREMNGAEPLVGFFLSPRPSARMRCRPLRRRTWPLPTTGPISMSWPSSLVLATLQASARRPCGRQKTRAGGTRYNPSIGANAYFEEMCASVRRSSSTVPGRTSPARMSWCFTRRVLAGRQGARTIAPRLIAGGYCARLSD